MEHLLNPIVKKISISAIRDIGNKVDQDPSIINFTIGKPDFVTPDSILEAGKRAIDERKISYTHNAGVLELRQAVSDFVKRHYQLMYDPEDEILITTGASEGLDVAFRTILEPGDEVILPAPIYPGYEPLIRMCNAVPVFVDTRKNDCKITPQLIKENLTEKTKCVLLPYPSNPTGTILNMEELEEIANFLRGKDIFIVSDEIYSELTYDVKHVSIASLPGMKDQCIVVNGLSKSHAMTGWRVGYTLAPRSVTKEMFKVHAYICVCASSISQYAAIEALKQDLPEVEIMRQEYKKRRDFIYDCIMDMGLDAIKPDGAFYIFVSIEKTGLKSNEFINQLVEKEKVAVIPGYGFSEYGEGYIRLSYACSMEDLKEGMRRIKRFVDSLKEVKVN
ncbi:aminotransferase A [Caldibacillus thermolactis]|jgi:aminotransferase|uniref:Aminotransferase n=1 Tax=Pallidibacillus thermolactis TaxID=251051 RepID=A0ABT2WFD4_9BACI|nr:aminotransferase A [Pallidibacillus thermolactis]MCU9594397.1 aminotransferase A [Pallidibacillus thermolactis]MCU9600617.1 aminotransferase A [Pallidibacillus thermolactis subsp. kokeshiiformis]